MGVTDFSRRDVERLLESALVPVEPSRQFVSRLKARLVRYRGGRMSPIWAMVASLAVATLLVVTSLALALRLLLSLLTLFFGPDRRGRARAESTSSA